MNKGSCRKTLILGIGCLLGSTIGCQTVPTRTLASPPLVSAPAPPMHNVHASSTPSPKSDATVSQVVVLWSEAVLRDGNTPMAQGFAGKVYLFGADSGEPMAVPGRMTFYAYDETDQMHNTRVKPDHTWEFDSSQLQKLLRKDLVGWTYLVWLPYSSPASSERRVTLIARFTPERGKGLLSDSTLVTLPAIHGTSSEALVRNSPRATVVHKPVVQTNSEEAAN